MELQDQSNLRRETINMYYCRFIGLSSFCKDTTVWLKAFIIIIIIILRLFLLLFLKPFFIIFNF